jgi:NADPH:quinone reductase-like Zn-dependent oxidoreductase
MKAAVISAYGGPDVISIQDHPTPHPKRGEVLVRVKAAPVTSGDARLRSGNVPRGMGLLLRAVIGWRRPRIAAGWGFAGIVESLGGDVTGLEIGQRVFGLKGFSGGTHAEYLVIAAAGAVLPLPDSLTFEEGAAFFFGGLTAAEFLIEKAGLKAGETVLICGATGAVGGAAVQIAAHLGAKVTAVASASNLDLARRTGAAAVHDYRTGPVQGQFDVVLDVMGTLGWDGARGLLNTGGRLCLITADLSATLGAMLRPTRAGRRIFASTVSESRAMMERLVNLHRAGGYRPVLGQVLPFDQLAEAHALAETFHKPGNLVVVMGTNKLT